MSPKIPKRDLRRKISNMKKSPLRKCLACLERKEKKDLIRIVKDSEGNFSVDKTGKLPGRGAYICKSEACIKKVQESKRLNAALRGNPPQEIYEELMNVTQE